MPSKLELEYKKTIKEAEYVHADLEYHEEVFKEALSGFNEQISYYFSKLSADFKNKLAIKKAAAKKQEEGAVPVADASGPGASDATTIAINENNQAEEVTPEKEAKPVLLKEVKKLFRKVAEHTHPDKTIASGHTAAQQHQRTELFKKAKKAFEEKNWFTLSSIAADLGIPMPEMCEDHIDWVRNDITITNKKIAKITNLTAWHWLHGDETQRKHALFHYFKHMHKFDHPDLK